MSEQRFYISQFKLANVQKIEASTVNIPDDVTEVVIGGQNESGKSSHLKGLFWLLTGQTGSSSSKFERNGSEKTVGTLTIKGTDGRTYTVTRSRDESGTKLTIKDQDGGSHLAKMLEGLLGPGAFLCLNPFKIAEQTPAERVKTFKKAFNIDFSELDKEDEELKDLAKELDAKATGIRGFFQGKPTYPDLPEEELSSGALHAEIEAISEYNSGRSTLEAVVTVAESAVKTAEAAVTTNSAEQSSIREEIEQLQQKLANKVSAGIALEATFKEKRDALKAAVANVDAFQVKDSSALKAQLEAIEETNQRIRDTKERDKYRVQHDEYEAQRVAANLRREQIKEEKRAIIAAIDFPIEGLSIEDGDIVVREPGQDPVPFDSLATSKRLRIGTAIGLGNSGPLKVVLTEDGDLYDDEKRAIVREMVKAAGGQHIIEMVRPSGGDMTLIIEEGKVKDAIQNQEALL
jgi:hypothetical protein